MTKGKIFQCEITVSTGVQQKLLQKHDLYMWEVEEVIYDDPNAFTLSYRDGYFVYGQTFSGRYLLVLVRILSNREASKLGFRPGSNVIKIITARDMNQKQRSYILNIKGTRDGANNKENIRHSSNG